MTRSHRSARQLLVLLALLSAFASTAPAAAAPSIAFYPSTVAVEGLEPGGGVAIFAVGRGDNGFVGWVRRFDQVLADDDLDGVVSWELGREVPPWSVWAAVDLATGELTLAVPEGGELHEIELPQGGIGATGRWLEADRRFLDVLLVRPGTPDGVWGAGFGDGAAGDGDGLRNRQLRAALDHLQPIVEGAAGPPDRLASGDVVVIVDQDTLDIHVARLAR